MNIEEHVVDLELSKKLAELCVKQNSLFYHINTLGIWNIAPCITDKDKMYFNNLTCDVLPPKEIYSAFTASELLGMIPNRITLHGNEPFDSFRFRLEKSFCTTDGKHFDSTYLINYFCDSTECEGEDAWLQRGLFDHNIWEKNLCNSLAMTLIILFEKEYITSIEYLLTRNEDIHRELKIENGKVTGII